MTRKKSKMFLFVFLCAYDIFHVPKLNGNVFFCVESIIRIQFAKYKQNAIGKIIAIFRKCGNGILSYISYFAEIHLKPFCIFSFFFF